MVFSRFALDGPLKLRQEQQPKTKCSGKMSSPDDSVLIHGRRIPDESVVVSLSQTADLLCVSNWTTGWPGARPRGSCGSWALVSLSHRCKSWPRRAAGGRRFGNHSAADDFTEKEEMTCEHVCFSSSFHFHPPPFSSFKWRRVGLNSTERFY